jgi:uncharacterized protein YjbI with pentapeptide repeats
MHPLQMMISQHQLWLQTEGREGRRGNFSGYDLRGADLRDIWAPEINMRGADLSGANLSGAELQGADLSEAILENTNFRNAKLDGANLSRTQAKRAYFDNASAISVNFSAAMMADASALHADFSGVIFRDAHLTHSDFTGAKLPQVVMRHCKAVGCVFDQADLSDADCRDCVFDFTRFRDAKLHGAMMRGASFEKVLFTDTDFRDVIELDPYYQSESMEWERQSVREEIENLQNVREEVAQYEGNIREQKRVLMVRKTRLVDLVNSEQELSSDLIRSMEWFRQLAIFWFIFTALLATILGYKVLVENSVDVENKTVILAIGVAVVILGAHFFTAALSFRTSRQFASYVARRQEALEQITFEGEDDPAGRDDSEGVTYL